MRTLVTGGAGFIGQHVVQQLARQHGSATVHVLDARTRAATGWTLVQGTIGDHLYLGDVCNPAEVHRAIEKSQPDVVLHLAAQSHVDRSLVNPNEAMLVNGYGTQVVAEACARSSTPLVYCSTDEVYGPATVFGRTPKSFDEVARLQPSSPYSAGKAAGEHAVHAMGTSAGLRYAITRGCNAWGIGQLGEKLIPIACARLNAGLPVPLHGGGNQLRQWVAATEFADALCTVAGWLADGDLSSGTVMNIAGPRICSVRDLVLALAAEAGVDPDEACVYATDRPGQDAAYCVDGARLRDLGWSASADLLDPKSLRTLLNAYRNAPVTLAHYLETPA